MTPRLPALYALGGNSAYQVASLKCSFLPSAYPFPPNALGMPALNAAGRAGGATLPVPPASNSGRTTIALSMGEPSEVSPDNSSGSTEGRARQTDVKRSVPRIGVGERPARAERCIRSVDAVAGIKPGPLEPHSPASPTPRTTGRWAAPVHAPAGAASSPWEMLPEASLVCGVFFTSFEWMRLGSSGAVMAAFAVSISGLAIMGARQPVKTRSTISSKRSHRPSSSSAGKHVGGRGFFAGILKFLRSYATKHGAGALANDGKQTSSLGNLTAEVGNVAG